MENLNQQTKIGLVTLVISSIAYGFTEYAPITATSSNDLFGPVFFGLYLLAIAYFIYSWIKNGWKHFKFFSNDLRSNHILGLSLFNISAYALNRELPVFHDSTAWLTIFLVIEHIVLIAYIIFGSDRKWLNVFFISFFTVCAFFHIYQTIMVTPIMPFGILGVFLIGISLHIFIPLCYSILTVVLIVSLSRKTPFPTLIPIGLGTSVILVTLGIFIFRFSHIQQVIQHTSQEYFRPGFEQDLPEWMHVAKQLPADGLTADILKADLVYQQFDKWGSFGLDGLNMDDEKRHDPIIAASLLFVDKPDISRENRIKMLNFLCDMRHETGDRFWSGLNLKTSHVTANIELFPKYRLSYSELILKIKNGGEQRNNRWFRQEEAIYTFNLPEGGCVTSLSLWIDGKEEKARLTTKGKAQEAYNGIVGRERRDPSVVYWMEGNQIRVRVFPCTTAEDRIFKLGVSAPLVVNNKNLQFKAPSFKGPDWSDAELSSTLIIHSENPAYTSNLDYYLDNNQIYYSGDFDNEITVSIPITPTSQQAFSFLNKSYELVAVDVQETRFNPTQVYLDLNNSWTQTEIDEITKQFKRANIKININQLSTFSSNNMSNWELPNFNLFPFHAIEDNGQTLIITKSTDFTPNLEDLDGTQFKQKLFAHCQSQNGKFKVYDLSKSASPYIKSLQELGIIDVSPLHDLSKVMSDLQKEVFTSYPTKDDVVRLASAGIGIKETTQKGTSDAPDHLLRLFAYNHVLAQIGPNYFNEDFFDETLIREAEIANVVTPISSLIVLETLNDYERFGIDENKDALGNAALSSSGSVPEPHEWALIIIGLFFITYQYVKWKRNQLA